MNARAPAEPDEIQAGKLLADHAGYQALVDRKETAKMGYGSWRNCGEYIARIAVLAGGICFFLPLDKAYALAWLGMAMIPFLSIAMEARWRRIHKSASEELAKNFPNGWPTRRNQSD